MCGRRNFNPRSKDFSTSLRGVLVNLSFKTFKTTRCRGPCLQEHEDGASEAENRPKRLAVWWGILQDCANPGRGRFKLIVAIRAIFELFSFPISSRLRELGRRFWRPHLVRGSCNGLCDSNLAHCPSACLTTLAGKTCHGRGKFVFRSRAKGSATPYCD
jgi:hypothetical protein